ncbi:MAG: RNA polymerase factor sigma-54 [Bdellovibrionaceae bacterium]|nr:RNA polymerase factor sigma-54 [Pseudobdellovibrionaceae bacterium]MDW8189573.1 RNA polymerase factor sigma-54 [Pseudobdellovibrionaceae bacterium]
MAKLNLSLKQIQTLKMTPQLQQAIKMLQMSRLELEEALRFELESNPLLEEMIDTEGGSRIEAQEVEVQVPNHDPEKQQEDFDWDTYFEKDKGRHLMNFAVNDEIYNYENIISTQQTLHEYLIWQAKMMGLNEKDLSLAELLIDYINDDGYLTISLEELSKSENVSVADLDRILRVIQEFDPAGVGARDLKECLIIQAKYLEEDTPDLIRLINDYLPYLEKKQYDVIAKEMGKDVQEIRDLARIITSMDPKPGRAYHVGDTQYVVPDVFVFKVGDDYVISLNEEGLPKLKISHFYKNVVQSDDIKTNEKGTKDFIKEKLNSAIWLIKSLQNRQRTIYRVTEAIMRHQREFLEKGPSALKPLILKDIAMEVGLHESTVSRVTSNKYVYTPQGVFELKYFFNSGITTTSGEGVAAESVKLRIKELISREDPRFPLSDQEIVDRLKAEGIQIARRTVAKYREALKILPSSRRKQTSG